MTSFKAPQINQDPNLPLVFPFGDPKKASTLKEFSNRLLALVCQQFLGKDRVLDERLLAEVDLFILPFWKPLEGQWFDKVEATFEEPSVMSGTEVLSCKDTLTLLFHNTQQERGA